MQAVGQKPADRVTKKSLTIILRPVWMGLRRKEKKKRKELENSFNL